MEAKRGHRCPETVVNFLMQVLGTKLWTSKEERGENGVGFYQIILYTCISFPF